MCPQDVYDARYSVSSDSGRCPHTAIQLLYMCPRTTVFVLVQLYVKRPHTTLYLEFAYYNICVFLLPYICVFLLPYIYSYMRVSPHTTMYLASAYYYVCVHSKHVIGLLYGRLSN